MTYKCTCLDIVIANKLLKYTSPERRGYLHVRRCPRCGGRWTRGRVVRVCESIALVMDERRKAVKAKKSVITRLKSLFKKNSSGGRKSAKKAK